MEGDIEKKMMNDDNSQAQTSENKSLPEDPESKIDSGPCAKRAKKTKDLVVAVVGCSHGEMDIIYAVIEEIQERHSIKIDLLLCCGDFQTVRNHGDLSHMRVPACYRQLQSFYRYYSGEEKAPVLTLFIGGNHEASGFLQELPYGGWVAPNIYYMGHASVVQYAGLRIGGLSGIYKYNDFNFGHFERPPFSTSSQISVFHTRSVDMFRLKQMKPSNHSDRVLDVMMSHDWPAGITDFGNVKELLKRKPHFKVDIEKNELGNPNSMSLLHELKPHYWFAGHLHCKFAAEVPHPPKDSKKFEPTKFLALDKVLPHREFLQVLNIEVDSDCEMELSYDPAWLAVLKATDELTSASRTTQYMPSSKGPSGERWDFRPTPDEMNRISEIFANDFKIPKNFRQTAAACISEYDDPREEVYYRNPQTTEFCTKMGIKNLNELLCGQSLTGVGMPAYASNSNGEIPYDDNGSNYVIDRVRSQESNV